MVRLLFFSDSHLGYDYPIKPRIDRNRRGMDFFDNFDTVLQNVPELNVDLVVHGGDLFFRSKVPGHIIDMVYDRLLAFAGKGVPLYIVPGNHERSVLPPSIWLNHPNIQIFDTPRVFHFDKGEAAIDLAGFPFVRDVESGYDPITAGLAAQLRPDAFPLLCIHQLIEGAAVGPTGYQFRRAKDIIPSGSLTSPWRGVLCGHVHRMQVFESRGGVPVYIPGSTERTSFAEIDETKGYFLLDIDPSAGTMTHEFVPLSSRPMVRISLTSSGESEELLYSQIRHRLSQIPRDAVVKIDAANKKQLKKLSMEKIRAVAPETMDVQLKYPPG
ncbi:metallophosphoesterase [Myxococcota bacterium]|nr:metallophosphoesterase [Myxococcota bacterium]